jgi:hypothetical protein
MPCKVSSQSCRYTENSQSISKYAGRLGTSGVAALVMVWLVMTAAVSAYAQATPTPLPHNVEFINNARSRFGWQRPTAFPMISLSLRRSPAGMFRSQRPVAIPPNVPVLVPDASMAPVLAPSRTNPIPPPAAVATAVRRIDA